MLDAECAALNWLAGALDSSRPVAADEKAFAAPGRQMRILSGLASAAVLQVAAILRKKAPDEVDVESAADFLARQALEFERDRYLAMSDGRLLLVQQDGKCVKVAAPAATPTNRCIKQSVLFLKERLTISEVRTQDVRRYSSTLQCWKPLVLKCFFLLGWLRVLGFVDFGCWYSISEVLS